jgi:hypothetical protein
VQPSQTPCSPAFQPLVSYHVNLHPLSCQPIALPTPTKRPQDGVLLLHREGRYTPGQTPLALLWKDLGCSRYLLVRAGLLGC